MKTKSVLFLLLTAMFSMVVFSAQPVFQYPRSGTNWEIGSIQNITWNPAGVSGEAQLVLQQNGRNLGFIVRSVSIAGGAYSWRVGEFESANVMKMANGGSGFTIMLHYAISGQRYVITSNSFSLSGGSDAPSISPDAQVTQPVNGSIYSVGRPMTISWDKNSINYNDVKISLHDSTGNLIKYITTRTANNGRFQWTVEGNLPASRNGYFVRIAAANDRNNNIDSGMFKIR